MAAQLLNGKSISKDIMDEIKREIAALSAEGRPPCLAVILASGDPASRIYTDSIAKACENVGVTPAVHTLAPEAGEEALLSLIDSLNADKGVDGMILQLPLPKGMDERAAARRISPAKDMDGAHPVNAGLLSVGEPCPLPCTPAGIIELLKRGGVRMDGARCVVVGRSNVVGKPAALLLLRENGTVTLCHSKTRDLPSVTREADILVVALGKPRFITPDMVKDGAVIVDAGIHREAGRKGICGDVDEACGEKASYITPVPGGVGSMTIAMLMKNCLQAYKNRGANERI